MSNKRQPPQAKPPNFAEQFFSLPVADISSVQQTALNLWQLGLNVFPLPYGAKGGYAWSMLQYTRLLSDDLYPLFRDNCNIAVMTGRTSSNLFVIDCETKASFEYHEKLLKKSRHPYLVGQEHGCQKWWSFLPTIPRRRDKKCQSR